MTAEIKTTDCSRFVPRTRHFFRPSGGSLRGLALTFRLRPRLTGRGPVNGRNRRSVEAQLRGRGLPVCPKPAVRYTRRDWLSRVEAVRKRTRGKTAQKCFLY